MKRYDYDKFHDTVIEYPDDKYVRYEDWAKEKVALCNEIRLLEEQLADIKNIVCRGDA